MGSLLSTISLPNVSLEDAGRYICIASHNSSTLRQDEDHEKLHVVPIIPPLVNMTNMKGDSITPLKGDSARADLRDLWTSQSGDSVAQRRSAHQPDQVSLNRQWGPETDVQFFAWL